MFPTLPKPTYTRKQLQKDAYGKDGKLFKYHSVAHFLVSLGTISVTSRTGQVVKLTVVCVDDRIYTINFQQRFINLSGSGAGEDHAILNQIIGEFRDTGTPIKLKPHTICGKARLVLTTKRALLRLSPPTDEEVEAFAVSQTTDNGLILGLEDGRKIETPISESPHRTEIAELDFHPGDGLLINLSELGLHNLLPYETYIQLPFQFAMTGHYFARLDESLIDFAVSEALLTNQIASEKHALGLVQRGFTVTAIVDVNDPLRKQKLAGLRIVFSLLKSKVHFANYHQRTLNKIRLNIVGYKHDKASSTVRFYLPK